MRLALTYPLLEFENRGTIFFRFVCASAFLVLSLAVSVRAQNPDPSKGEVQSIAFCDLIENPEFSDQKRLRIKATYRYGYEWSELFCMDCRDKGLVWLDFQDTFDARTKPKVRKNIKWSEKGRTVNIIAVGKFYREGRYGHMGGYAYKFVADYFESADVILRDSPVLLPEAVRKKASCLNPQE